MKAGDLVTYGFWRDTELAETGLVIARILDSTLPSDWPRILVLWNNGKRESMHEEDLEVVSESR